MVRFIIPVERRSEGMIPYAPGVIGGSIDIDAATSDRMERDFRQYDNRRRSIIDKDALDLKV